jgi:ribosomal protein S18 acetylase RimI-like enzyme
MHISYRPAQPEDAESLAEISILAGGGTFELLLKGMKRGLDVKAIMAALAGSPITEYSYKFFRVAEVEGEIAAGINAISKEDRYKYAPNINPLLQSRFGFGLWQLAKFYFRARHLKGMNVLKVPAGSFHINDIAVLPEYQGLGIGKELVLQTIDYARKHGYKYVTLYVWTDNESAIGFYHKLGFKIEKTATIVPHKYLPHSGSHLMILEIT